MDFLIRDLMITTIGLNGSGGDPGRDTTGETLIDTTGDTII